MKMPAWGPYSKKYMGISHVVEEWKKEGARFDFIVQPTIWNSSIPAPNVTFPSSYHLWECSSDYSYYSYRYDLIWKDQAYADVSFTRITDDAYLAKCKFVNNTDRSQNCILNAFAAMEFPFAQYAVASLPEGAILKGANDYETYEYAKPRPWDTENPDGMFKGMFRDKNFVDGCGLGDRVAHSQVKFLDIKPFGCEKGDSVSYSLKANGLLKPVLALRYRTVSDGDAKFSLNGKETVLPASNELCVIYLPYAENPEFVSLGGAGVELDFLALVEEGSTVSVENRPRTYRPEIDFKADSEKSVITLRYEGLDTPYVITMQNSEARLRTLESGCLEDALANRLSNGDPTFDDLAHTFSHSFARKTSDEGFFANPLIKGIFVAPHSTHEECMIISRGAAPAKAEIEKNAQKSLAKWMDEQVRFNADGAPYDLSTRILRSTLLMNVVYPVYCHGENVIHHAPGKRWDSFYTWDSGFIGLGLLESSSDLCRYVLETYLCDEDNKDFAFLHHGSLVPTQFSEYIELMKRTKDKHCLDSLYPKLKRYYEFLRGRLGSSTMNKFKNGLVTPYDYWYSCSGMDDYPAQVEMIKNGAESYSCACLPGSQAVIAAKVMKMVATMLGKTDDVKEYEADIAQTAESLNRFAWDEESGYYAYTMYDQDFDRPYQMKTKDGENWDKGMDGIYPLIAGVCPEDRAAKIMAHLKNSKELWSDAGVSAVDMTASYYMDDGYWNGNVWMSHQWFVWKAMMDRGETDFAFEIAHRALELWKAETDDTYNTSECFGIKTLRGGWFHQFGGLSAPVAIWANAYYKPGTVTTGFDVWTNSQENDGKKAKVDFRYFGCGTKYSILICLSDEVKAPKAYLNGKPVAFNLRTKGCVEVTLPGTVKEGVLEIR